MGWKFNYAPGRITEIIDRSRHPMVSFEIIPPLRKEPSLDEIMKPVEVLSHYRPPFIDVTTHPPAPDKSNGDRGIRKRPGTGGICIQIQNAHKIPAVPHVLCRGFDTTETEEFLVEMVYSKIRNFFALQGDDKGYKKVLKPDRKVHAYAIDLARQIRKFAADYPVELDIALAGYPEGHFESADSSAEMQYLKAKVDAAQEDVGGKNTGSCYIVTQMSYDNSKILDFIRRCREFGIDVPIVVGLKILERKSHVQMLERMFHIEIPRELKDEIASAKEEHVPEIGVNWVHQQVEGLFNAGIPVAHFYVMRDTKNVVSLLDRL